jgi:hypothetical protein
VRLRAATGEHARARPSANMHAGHALEHSAVDVVMGRGVQLVFFGSDAALAAEQALYGNAALAPLLPQLLQFCPGGPADACGGAPLPPFLVTERGETLPDCVSRSRPTFPQAVAVRTRCTLSNDAFMCGLGCWRAETRSAPCAASVSLLAEATMLHAADVAVVLCMRRGRAVGCVCRQACMHAARPCSGVRVPAGMHACGAAVQWGVCAGRHAYMRRGCAAGARLQILKSRAFADP